MWDALFLYHVLQLLFVEGKVSTLSMFYNSYKGQSIWDGRQNFKKNKGQDLALFPIARDIFSRWMLGHDKGLKVGLVATREIYFIPFTQQKQNKA